MSFIPAVFTLLLLIRYLINCKRERSTLEKSLLFVLVRSGIINFSFS